MQWAYKVSFINIILGFSQSFQEATWGHEDYSSEDVNTFIVVVATRFFLLLFDNTHSSNSFCFYVEILNDSFRGEGGFDFAIRTPCMPSRWDDFDAEMTMAWEVSQPSPQNSRPKLLACLLSCFRFSIKFIFCSD